MYDESFHQEYQCVPPKLTPDEITYRRGLVIRQQTEIKDETKQLVNECVKINEKYEEVLQTSIVANFAFLQVHHRAHDEATRAKMVVIRLSEQVESLLSELNKLRTGKP